LSPAKYKSSWFICEKYSSSLGYEFPEAITTVIPFCFSFSYTFLNLSSSYVLLLRRRVSSISIPINFKLIVPPTFLQYIYIRLYDYSTSHLNCNDLNMMLVQKVFIFHTNF